MREILTTCLKQQFSSATMAHLLHTCSIHAIVSFSAIVQRLYNRLSLHTIIFAQGYNTLNMPLAPMLDLLRPLFPEPVVNLFDFVLRSTYFQSEGEFYEKVKGVAMGSPLSSVITDFIEALEKIALEMTHYN